MDSSHFALTKSIATQFCLHNLGLKCNRPIYICCACWVKAWCGGVGGASPEIGRNITNVDNPKHQTNNIAHFVNLSVSGNNNHKVCFVRKLINLVSICSGYQYGLSVITFVFAFKFDIAKSNTGPSQSQSLAWVDLYSQLNFKLQSEIHDPWNVCSGG